VPQQQSLFETQPPPWELDDASQRLVATVVLPGGPAGEFDYLVPDVLLAGGRELRIEPGRRLRVPGAVIGALWVIVFR
jgi:primosomal protein N' (replication factor Y)